MKTSPLWMPRFLFACLSVAFALVVSSTAYAGQTESSPRLTITTKWREFGISMPHYRHHMTILAPFRRDHRWIGKIDGRPVNELKFYQAANNAAAVAKVQRRRRQNKVLFWTGFIATLSGVMMDTESESQAMTIAGRSIAFSGCAVMVTGLFRSFKQATPSSRALKSARAHNDSRRQH